MTATVVPLHDYLENVRQRVPRDLHPVGLTHVHEYLSEAHYYADIGDAAEVKRFLDLVLRRVVLELRWQAESWETARCHREAWLARRQADRIEGRR